MKLSELIKKCGDDVVMYQKLDDDSISFDDKKTHREIKFGTPETFHVDKTVKMGLVVWLDRDKVKSILQEQKN